tara:strand:- start:1465 stop:1839 length:375 start_codon:yes stop_codon:yes gene_type:complete
MTKVELEVKIEALQKLLGEKVTEQTNYQNQINELQQKLDNLNKPKLTGLQFSQVAKAIETAVMNYPLDEIDNYSIDYGIDYDNRITCESFTFDSADDLVEDITCSVEYLFEIIDDEDNNQENQN